VHLRPTVADKKLKSRTKYALLAAPVIQILDESLVHQADRCSGFARDVELTVAPAAIVRVSDTVSKALADGRKLAALAGWGIITRSDGVLRLGERGSTLVRHPDREQEVFRGIIGHIRPYHSALEWAHHQGMGALDTNDVASHWHEHHHDVVGDANKNTLRENAVCFFHIAEAAGLGTITVGRSGRATRLGLDKEQLGMYVESGPSDPPWQDDEPEAEAEPENRSVVDPEQSEEQPPAAEAKVAEPLRVFISHGSNKDVVEQIEVMLGLADIKAEVAEAEETAAIPVPEKVLNSMRRCSAGIIAVTVDESRKDEDGEYTLNENVLIEIGAAFVLYDRRVVLL
jgi:hypothetical protein